MTTDEVPGVHTVTDAVELANHLMLGGFCVLRWDLIPDDSDLADWKASLTALCEERGVELDLTDLPRQQCTFVQNVKAVPTFEQARDLVAGVQLARWRSQDS